MLGSAAHAAFTSCLPTCWTYVSPAGRGRADHIAVTLGDTPDADDHHLAMAETHLSAADLAKLAGPGGLSWVAIILELQEVGNGSGRWR